MGKAGKIGLAVLFFIVLVTVQAHANCGMCDLSKEGSADYVAKKVQKLTDKLGLSADQAAQVEVLIKEKTEKKMAIHKEKHNAMETVKEEYSAKIKALLNDDQKAKYDTLQAEWKAEDMKGSDLEHKGSGHEHKGSAHDM